MMAYVDSYDDPMKAECDTKPLEGLASIAEEAERAATLIDAFITRFRHGSGPIGTGTTQIKPVPSGHAGQLERLRDAVFTVDKLARELGTIG
jgi:hypothetical protein